MKKLVIWIGMLALALSVSAALPVMEDGGYAEDDALLTWRTSSRWQASLLYGYLNRDVTMDDVTLQLRADIVEASVGVSPWPWLLLYGQVGGSQARLNPVMRDDSGAGAGGLLGAQLNLWQIYPAREATAWRLLLQVVGEVSYRTASDDVAGDLEWTTGTVMLPFFYHLTLARSELNARAADFHSLAIYAGPEVSWVDGNWTRGGIKRSFREEDSVGAVVGAELWLIEHLSFGVRAEWLGERTSGQMNVRYRF